MRRSALPSVGGSGILTAQQLSCSQAQPDIGEGITMMLVSGLLHLTVESLGPHVTTKSSQGLLPPVPHATSQTPPPQLTRVAAHA